MFGLFGKKPFTERVAELLSNIAMNHQMDESERKYVESAGIDTAIYRVEMLAFRSFSVLSGFLYSRIRADLSDEEEKQIIDSYFLQIKNKLSSLSPRPDALYEHIRLRINDYHKTQNSDLEAAENGAVGASMPSQFAHNLASDGGEIPFEFMPIGSEIFHKLVEATDSKLAEIKR